MVAVASAAAVATAAVAGTLPSFTQVDVSQADGAQAEVAVAADPTNPNVLLAASNSLTLAAACNFTRVYTSVDGGASWSSLPAPKPAPVQRVAQCSAGDPGTAIGHSDDDGSTWAHPAVVSAGSTDPTFASLAIDAAGTVFAAWTDAGRGLYVATSVDGETFRQAAVVGPLPPLQVGRTDLHCSTRGAFDPPAQALRCVTPTPQILVDSRAGRAEQLYLTYSGPDAAQTAEDVFVAKL